MILCEKKFILLVIPKIEEENESKCELWYWSVRSWKSAIHEIENVSDIPYHPLHWHEDKFWWISENEGEEKWATHIIQLQSKIWEGRVKQHHIFLESTNFDNFRKHEKGVNENVSGGFSRNEKVGRVWREGRVVPASTLHTSHSLVCIVWLWCTLRLC